MINYTTTSEYYLQEGNQIIAISSVEGKNTPPNKTHKKHPSVRGRQSPLSCRTACLPLLLLLLLVLQVEIHVLCFFFCKTMFRCCILISALSDYIMFKPDLRFQKSRQRGNIWAPIFETTVQGQKKFPDWICFWLPVCKMDKSTDPKVADCLFIFLQLKQNRSAEFLWVQKGLNFLEVSPKLKFPYSGWHNKVALESVKIVSYSYKYKQEISNSNCKCW